MSINAIHTEIRTKLVTVWTDLNTIAFPNIEFNPPPLDTGEWIRLTIKGGEEQQLTIGSPNNAFRNTGIIIIQIFTPLNVGSSPGLTHGDTIADAFRNFCGINLKCRTATVKDLGDDGQGWYQVNVVIPFIWDNIN